MELNKNKSISDRLYLSTVAEDAAMTAEEYKLGLEIAEFCTAMNMDEDFPAWDSKARAKMKSAERFVMHAPFNELCPSAIDPLVLEIAFRRYEQAYKLAKSYGINRMVVHSGYVPFVYFKTYFAERSIAFWKKFLEDKPENLTLVLENVLEDAPDTLIEIVKGVNDPRFKLCFDVGHANITKSGITMEQWTRAVLPHLGHVHLHNNYGWPDHHNALGDGTIDMENLLRLIITEQPAATLTIEALETKKSVEWLIEKGFLEATKATQ